jgi:hypothetical protein
VQGLVRQQLDSYDSFLEIGLQECVDDAGELTITSEIQYGPGSTADQALKRCKIHFSQVRGVVVVCLFGHEGVGTLSAAPPLDPSVVDRST